MLSCGTQYRGNKVKIKSPCILQISLNLAGGLFIVFGLVMAYGAIAVEPIIVPMLNYITGCLRLEFLSGIGIALLLSARYLQRRKHDGSD
jgi:hypothetical protein